MVLNKKKIYLFGLLYLEIPLLLFFIGWIRQPFSVILIAFLVGGYYLVYRNASLFGENDVVLSKKTIFFVIIVLLAWCVFGGQGGFLFQTSDFGCRNAVYRDLINHSWPVIYKNNYFLCYYFGFWLMPALISKIFIYIGCSTQVVWFIANQLLLLWTFLGVFLSYLITLSILKTSVSRYQLLILIVLILFSGLDIIGLAINKESSFSESIRNLHIEWWANYYQMSSNTTQLYWVFNQAIPAWIATGLLVMNKSVKNDIYIGVLSAFLSPLPVFGLFVIGVAKVTNLCIKEIHHLKKIMQELLTAQNILALFLFIPIFYFFMQSTRTSGTGDGGLFNTSIGGVSEYHLFILILFAFLEYGVYIFLVYKRQKSNAIIYFIGVCLCIFTCVKLGDSPDFSMRATIPLLFVLMIYVMEELLSIDFKKNKGRQIACLLCFTLIVGSVTPIIEIVRGPINVIREKKMCLVDDSIETFDGYSLKDGEISNFIGRLYNNTSFAKIIGKQGE